MECFKEKYYIGPQMIMQFYNYCNYQTNLKTCKEYFIFVNIPINLIYLHRKFLEGYNLKY